MLVVGGGASAAEIAGNLLHLRATSAPDLRVTIASDATRLLPTAPRGASRRAAESLTRRGARLRFDTRIEAIGDGAAHLASGERIACDLAILATGLRPNRLMARLGLSVRGGGLRVGTDLAAIGDRDVFAAGTARRSTAFRSRPSACTASRPDRSSRQPSGAHRETGRCAPSARNGAH